MANTWYAHLTDFLDEDGMIAPKSGPAKRIAEYFTKLVVDVTTPITENPRKAAVRCRRRPGRKPCTGTIETDIDAETEQIMWWCPVCGDKGYIDSWQGSFWDRTSSVSK